MINLGISLMVYALLVLVLNVGAGLSPLYAALLALLGFAGCFFLLRRRTTKQLTQLSPPRSRPRSGASCT